MNTACPQGRTTFNGSARDSVCFISLSTVEKTRERTRVSCAALAVCDTTVVINRVQTSKRRSFNGRCSRQKRFTGCARARARSDGGRRDDIAIVCCRTHAVNRWWCLASPGASKRTCKRANTGICERRHRRTSALPRSFIYSRSFTVSIVFRRHRTWHYADRSELTGCG